MDVNTPFRLFTCCFPIAGATRCLICDVQRQTYQFIPSALHEILTEHQGKTIDIIKIFYSNQYDDIIYSRLNERKFT